MDDWLSRDAEWASHPKHGDIFYEPACDRVGWRSGYYVYPANYPAARWRGPYATMDEAKAAATAPQRKDTTP